MGVRHRAPRVVLSDSARVSVLAAVLANPDVEHGGVLHGRATDEIVEIERAAEIIPVRTTADSFDFLEEHFSRAARATHKLTGMDHVGDWHSHVHANARGLEFLAPQLSANDKGLIASSNIELVVACAPWAGSAWLRTRDMRHIERVAGRCFKIEAWWKAPRRCKPCEITVLGK